LEKGAYSVLVDDIDDDDELAVVLAVVDEGDPSDLHVPLERLQITEKANQIQISKTRSKNDVVLERGVDAERGSPFWVREVCV
jgi:hypothetical protein